MERWESWWGKKEKGISLQSYHARVKIKTDARQLKRREVRKTDQAVRQNGGEGKNSIGDPLANKTLTANLVK